MLTGTIAALGLAWAIISYGLTKRSELALERTKFIFDNLRYFETDEALQEANRIVGDLSKEFTTEKFLEIMMPDDDANIDETGLADVSDEQIAKCTAVDSYLNFLWRIAYAHFELRTITINDMDAFGYYFYLISKDIGLLKYCAKEGFEEVIYAIRKLKPYWDAADIKNRDLIREVDKLVPQANS